MSPDRTRRQAADLMRPATRKRGALLGTAGHVDGLFSGSDSRGGLWAPWHPRGCSGSVPSLAATPRQVNQSSELSRS